MKIIFCISLIFIPFIYGFSQINYNFVGNGKWSNVANWSNNQKPPTNLLTGSTIFISSQIGDSCLLDYPQELSSGANLIVSNGARLILPYGISNYLDSIQLHTKLRKINFPIDTVAPLCQDCPLIVTQKSEIYIYDSLNRIIQRKLITTSLSNNPVTIDTALTCSYFYISTSPLISRYEKGSLNYLLLYDNQNRLIKDSLENQSLSSNNKLRYLRYSADTIFRVDKQTSYTGVDSYILDTMIVLGNNVIKENISFNKRKVNFILSAFRNPYSFVNNFSLYGSDYLTSTGFLSFFIKTPEQITYNQTLSTNVTYGNLPNQTEYTSTFTTTLDSFSRISTLQNSSNGNKTVSFNYE